MRLGAHVANPPYVAFGRPSCELALRSIWVPNLGEAIIKNLPSSQNWFLSVLQLVFFPSAPLCGRFRYESFFRLGAHLANSPCVAFGHPYCVLVALLCVQVPTLPTCVVLHLGGNLANSPCIALGRPCCQLSSRSILVPILPAHLSPCLGTLPHFRNDSPCGHLSFQVGLPSGAQVVNLPCLCTPTLPTRPALPCGNPQFFLHMSCVAGSSVLLVGCPSCELALRCVWAY